MLWMSVRPLIKTDDNCGAPVLVNLLWKESLVSSALCPRYDRVEWSISDDTEVRGRTTGPQAHWLGQLIRVTQPELIHGIPVLVG